MAKGWFVVEKARRCLRTVFFMVAMVASLLVSSLPVLVAIGDVLVPSFLLSSFSCVTCYGVKEHLRRYGFKSSLTDIPLVSIVRSLLVICVYLLSDGPALSHGPYLGTVSLCSVVSILLLSVKSCVFTVNSQLKAEASSSLSRQRLHLKKSWGMPVLFLSSVVFALGHTVVAYRTSYRARRKLSYHRVDPETVLSCKSVFSGYQKIPRSPTPLVGKSSKIDTEIRRKPDEEGLPVRLLADLDSLFITVRGLIVHYKLSLPGSPLHSVSSASLLEANSKYSMPETTVGRLKIDRKVLSTVSKTQHQHHHHHRSYSNQFSSSSLHVPLLDGPPTSVPSKDILAFSLDGTSQEDDTSASSFGAVEQTSDGNGQFGVVLVHGFGGGIFSWRHVMGSLACQLCCVVVAFDRPGWGLTSRPHKKDFEERELPNPYMLESQVDLLLLFCSEMGFSSVVFVGHDDGGLLALKAAQRLRISNNHNSITVKGVVLLSVSLSREVVPAFARIILHTSLGKKHLVRPLLRTEIAQVVNRHAWYDATKLTTEALKLYKAPLYIEGWDEALHEIGRFSYEMVLAPQSAATLLKSVEDLPVLVIAGAEDALVPLKSSQAMASTLVNSRLVAISGCGHLPHEECPKALLAAMSPFISRIVARPELQNQ